ncbi:Lsr2 family protein [Streptomyces sp. NPDC020719]|uniref:histone-like nucleoid-structuring protein Lsr2 n=1 Tax=Streptomyces sp. NPDC020719 TaxID=3154896 RepID=UPI0033FB0F01
MAQKIVTVYIDDLTGEETQEASTHVLVLDGVAYEMDLAPESYDQLLEALARFTKAGRRIKGGGRGRSALRGPGGNGNQNTAEVRRWAKEQGYAVNDRGRVPADIREAFEKRTK